MPLGADGANLPGVNRLTRFIEQDVNLDNLVIFSDYEMLHSYFRARHISGDGNFGHRPYGPEFAQIYSMHAVFQQLPERTQGVVYSYSILFCL